MTLDQLPIGQLATIKAFKSPLQNLQVRLISMGIQPSRKVSLLRHAPLADPIQVKVGNTLLSIRREEAKQIEVEQLTKEAQ